MSCARNLFSVLLLFRFQLIGIGLISLVFCGMVLPSAKAQTGETPRIAIPNLWDPQQRFIKPNIKGLQRLRFLTTTDFPPFSFVDGDKRLVGFHIDLARAICEELNVLPVCQIQAIPFDELERALLGGQGDLVLAGLAITPDSRKRLNFSRPYFRLPARFLVRSENTFREPLGLSLANKSVAVVDGTAHAAFAKATFGDMRLRLFETRTRALRALRSGDVEAYFGDGLTLARWLQTEEIRATQKKQTTGSSRGAATTNNSAATANNGSATTINGSARAKPCCVFAGGPYYSTTYFGHGLSVAMAPGNPELESAINFALRSISDKGKFAELYLRYFPISVF